MRAYPAKLDFSLIQSKQSRSWIREGLEDIQHVRRFPRGEFLVYRDTIRR
jgi:hypothetical protein